MIITFPAAVKIANTRLTEVEDCLPVMSEMQRKLLVNLLAEQFLNGQAARAEQEMAREIGAPS